MLSRQRSRATVQTGGTSDLRLIWSNSGHRWAAFTHVSFSLIISCVCETLLSLVLTNLMQRGQLSTFLILMSKKVTTKTKSTYSGRTSRWPTTGQKKKCHIITESQKSNTWLKGDILCISEDRRRLWEDTGFMCTCSHKHIQSGQWGREGMTSYLCIIVFSSLEGRDCESQPSREFLTEERRCPLVDRAERCPSGVRAGVWGSRGLSSGHWKRGRRPERLPAESQLYGVFHHGDRVGRQERDVGEIRAGHLL